MTQLSQPYRIIERHEALNLLILSLVEMLDECHIDSIFQKAPNTCPLRILMSVSHESIIAPKYLKLSTMSSSWSSSNKNLGVSEVWLVMIPVFFKLILRPKLFACFFCDNKCFWQSEAELDSKAMSSAKSRSNIDVAGCLLDLRR